VERLVDVHRVSLLRARPRHGIRALALELGSSAETTERRSQRLCPRTSSPRAPRVVRFTHGLAVSVPSCGARIRTRERRARSAQATVSSIKRPSRTRARVSERRDVAIRALVADGEDSRDECPRGGSTRRDWARHGGGVRAREQRSIEIGSAETGKVHAEHARDARSRRRRCERVGAKQGTSGRRRDEARFFEND